MKMTDVSRMANPQEPFVCNGEAAKDDPDVPQEQQPVSDLIIDIARGGLVRNQAQPRRFFDCYRIRYESDHCRRCSSFFAPRIRSVARFLSLVHRRDASLLRSHVEFQLRAKVMQILARSPNGQFDLCRQSDIRGI